MNRPLRKKEARPNMPHINASRAGRAIASQAAALLRVRWFVRAPIWLYRARLGFLFGSRLLMLEHIGRTSGERRYVVLEVIAHPGPSSYIVASGFGDRAQWFRNIRVNPQVRVYLGSRRPAPAIARALTGEQSGSALTAYANAIPAPGAPSNPSSRPPSTRRTQHCRWSRSTSTNNAASPQSHYRNSDRLPNRVPLVPCFVQQRWSALNRRGGRDRITS
ncbi:deazaflavin-dependent oxidoreductase (nitroreductase family) [Nakamurella sp. UYEF19]